MLTVASLKARQILDSRGNPTVEVDCTLSDGSFGRAAVPSGASTGSHEALELRDGDKANYLGKSVTKAVGNVVNEILPALKDKDVTKQRDLDHALLALDGTPNKSRLGANAILGVSMAVARARAASEKQPLWRSLATQFAVPEPRLLPVPLMNVINGGAHADSGLSFQECMIVPTGFSTFAEALRAGAETFHALKSILKEGGHVTAVGDEGGFAPHLENSFDAFDTLMKAIEKAGYTGKMQLAIDAAASEFYKEGVYHIDGKTLNSDELVGYYEELCARYPIVSIEDSHAEDDWAGFQRMVQKLGSRVQLVGDDLLVTNVARIQEALTKNAANAILIKLNQIGTVTETLECMELAAKNGYTCMVSHRSGETEDSFIADFTVATGAGQIKTGSASRSDRLAKYNHLIRIEQELGSAARYAGRKAYSR